MRIKTRRLLIQLSEAIGIYVAVVALFMAILYLPVLPLLQTLLGSGSTLGGNILLIILIIATVVTGIFGFLSDDGTDQSLSTNRPHHKS